MSDKQAPEQAADEKRAAEGKYRMDSIRTPEQVATIPHLSPEDQKFAVETIKRTPPTDGWRILANDPDVMAAWQMMERYHLGLLYPEFQAMPGTTLSMMTVLVGKHRKSEYVDGLLSSYLTRMNDVYKKGDDANTKMLMLEHPDAAFWTDEERLTIKFVNATLDNKMTDELFAEAIKTWGEQKTIRYLSWIAYVDGLTMIQDAMGTKYALALRPPKAMSVEATDQIIGFAKDDKEALRKAWLSLKPFPGKF
jgi:hypothetical protein